MCHRGFCLRPVTSIYKSTMWKLYRLLLHSCTATTSILPSSYITLVLRSVQPFLHRDGNLASSDNKGRNVNTAWRCEKSQPMKLWLYVMMSSTKSSHELLAAWLYCICSKQMETAHVIVQQQLRHPPVICGKVLSQIPNAACIQIHVWYSTVYISQL